MGLETGTYVSDLTIANPVGASDPKSQGDDHLRLIKKVLRNTFPNGDKPISQKGSDVASASALTPPSDGDYFDVTGTTSITSIATQGIGSMIRVHFDGALTLTHNASDLILPGGVNITTAAGDEALFIEYATGDWRCLTYLIAAEETGAFAAEHDTDGTHTDITSDSISSAHLTATGVAPASPVAKRLYEDTIVKAWVNFSNAGTPTIRGDVNISSLTDAGAGITQPTYTTNFANDDYAAVACGNDQDCGTDTHAVGSCRIKTPASGGGSDDAVDLLCVGKN
tara:strand:+ start:718 stop:1563 length:846 start_codon:yes stop_codon:yes gene_type:complete